MTVFWILMVRICDVFLSVTKSLSPVKVRDINFDELITRISDLLSSFKHSVKARLARFLVLTDNFPLLPILGALIRHGFC